MLARDETDFPMACPDGAGVFNDILWLAPRGGTFCKQVGTVGWQPGGSGSGCGALVSVAEEPAAILADGECNPTGFRRQ